MHFNHGDMDGMGMEVACCMGKLGEGNMMEVEDIFMNEKKSLLEPFIAFQVIDLPLLSNT